MAEVVFRSTQYMALSDLNDIAVFVQALSTPQARHAGVVTPTPAPRDERFTQGEKIYADHCAQCHGDNGQGVPGLYVALAGNRAVTLANPVNLIRVVVQGGFAPATAGNPRPFGMPPFRQTLDDGQIAAVLSYIRQAWGHDASPVSPLDLLQNL
jgi:mono/diheme cytochrome c family protein